MVPLGTLVDVRETIGPQIITRYNLYPSAAITGEAAPGHSSGQALALMEQMAASKLPPVDGLRMDGDRPTRRRRSAARRLSSSGSRCCSSTSCSRRSTRAGRMPAGRHPRGAARAPRHGDRGRRPRHGQQRLHADRHRLAHRAREQERDPHRRVRARAAGARQERSSRRRSRRRVCASGPILMTSFAFILGVFPLVIADGAGAASRRALGTAVFGGHAHVDVPGRPVRARVLRGGAGSERALGRAAGHTRGGGEDHAGRVVSSHAGDA